MPHKTRRLLWPFLGLLALSMALQAASLVAMLEIEARADRSRQHVAAAAGLLATIEHFENATYLALVGLASSDWEMLLRQRAAAQTLAERFVAVSGAMVQGEARGHGGELPLQGIHMQGHANGTTHDVEENSNSLALGHALEYTDQVCKCTLD